MTKNIFLLLGLLVATSLFFTSCKESEEEGEWDNWKERNEHFIDSIATVARANRDGSWTVMKAFNLGDGFPMNADNKYYVYMQKLEEGAGTESPLYNDSIRVHYSGRLIPTATYPAGYNFGKSYSGSVMNAETDVPALMGVNQNVVGFATAMMHMKVGDRCKLYIPYYLGYGTSDYATAKIPGYSALIFDVKLAKIYKYQIDTDTSWWTKKRK